MSDAISTVELDELLNLLDAAEGQKSDSAAETSEAPAESPPPTSTAQPKSTSADAIDRALAAPSRQTAVVSLRQSPVVQMFRQELTDGMIRADSVNRLLRLVNEVVARLLA